MKHEIFLCDGQKIRNNIHPDFVCVGADGTTFVRTNFPWLPKNSILLDKNFQKESNYFNKLIDKYWGLEGEKYYQLRKKSFKKSTKPFNTYVKKVLYKKSGFIFVVYDGLAIRREIDEESQLGINGLVYSWAPKNILGVEQNISVNEREFVLLHEEVEVKKMINNKVSYDIAHDWATAAEMEVRRLKGHGIYPRDENFIPIKNWGDFCKRFGVRKIT